ncbi:MAG: hypothetical protein EXR77_09005 [Myxococcales bacterium]|nr:hypothetical protein [Myxococcales bacterium]
MAKSKQEREFEALLALEGGPPVRTIATAPMTNPSTAKPSTAGQNLAQPNAKHSNAAQATDNQLTAAKAAAAVAVGLGSAPVASSPPAPIAARAAATPEPAQPTAAQWLAELNERDERFAALQHQQVELTRQLTAAQARLAQGQAEAADLIKRQSDADSERRVLSRKVTDSQHQIAELRRVLDRADRRDLLRQRGLNDDEQVRAVVHLVRCYKLAALAALLDSDPQPLTRLLERIVVSCGAVACTPKHDDVAVLEVSRDRCEVCGGSDSRQAFALFCQLMHQLQLDRYTVVGGSPAYREMLRDLNRTFGTGLHLTTVADLRPDADKRARQVRGLVIIWGATAVDHAVTGHYRQAGDVVLEIAHRGIGGMLRKAAELLSMPRA